MNTIIKLEEKLTKLGVSLHVSSPDTGSRIVHLSKAARTVSSEAATLDLAIERALKKWASSDPDEMAAAVLADQAIDITHADLPGHEHCNQRYCATCRSGYDVDSLDEKKGWLVCVTLLCPACLAEQQEAARGQKHPIEHFLDQDYPVTIYEDVDDDGSVVGYVGDCRDLPGCTGRGTTQHEAYTKAKEASKAWIETAASMGERIPLPSPAPED